MEVCGRQVQKPVWSLEGELGEGDTDWPAIYTWPAAEAMELRGLAQQARNMWRGEGIKPPIIGPGLLFGSFIKIHIQNGNMELAQYFLNSSYTKGKELGVK